MVVDSDSDITIMNFVEFDTEAGPRLEVAEELMGFNDEILDAKFIKHVSKDGINPELSRKLNKWSVLATNSETLKFYNYESGKTKLVQGHKKMVLC